LKSSGFSENPDLSGDFPIAAHLMEVILFFLQGFLPSFFFRYPSFLFRGDVKGHRGEASLEDHRNEMTVSNL